MENPKFEDYMLPALEVMSDGNVRSTTEIYNALAEKMKLSDEVLSERFSSNGRPKYKSTMHWALNDLKFAGLLVVVKFGVYKITDEGLKVSKMGLKSINREWLRTNYKAFDDYILYGAQKEETESEKMPETNISSDTPIEQLTKIEKVIKESVCSELLEALKTGTPAFFEKSRCRCYC